LATQFRNNVAIMDDYFDREDDVAEEEEKSASQVFGGDAEEEESNRATPWDDYPRLLLTVMYTMQWKYLQLLRLYYGNDPSPAGRPTNVGLTKGELFEYVVERAHLFHDRLDRLLSVETFHESVKELVAKRALVEIDANEGLPAKFPTGGKWLCVPEDVAGSIRREGVAHYGADGVLPSEMENRLDEDAHQHELTGDGMDGQKVKLAIVLILHAAALPAVSVLLAGGGASVEQRLDAASTDGRLAVITLHDLRTMLGNLFTNHFSGEFMPSDLFFERAGKYREELIHRACEEIAQQRSINVSGLGSLRVHLLKHGAAGGYEYEPLKEPRYDHAVAIGVNRYTLSDLASDMTQYGKEVRDAQKSEHKDEDDGALQLDDEDSDDDGDDGSKKGSREEEPEEEPEEEAQVEEASDDDEEDDVEDEYDDRGDDGEYNEDDDDDEEEEEEEDDVDVSDDEDEDYDEEEKRPAGKKAPTAAATSSRDNNNSGKRSSTRKSAAAPSSAAAAAAGEHTPANKSNYENTARDRTYLDWLSKETALIQQDRKATGAKEEVAKFVAARQKLAQDVYAEYNREIFGGKLPADMPIEWNNRLFDCAGKFKFLWFTDKKWPEKRRYKPYVRGEQKIELAPKFINTEKRLRHVMLHEMCHAAEANIDREFCKENVKARAEEAKRDRVSALLAQIQAALRAKGSDKSPKIISINKANRGEYDAEDYVSGLEKLLADIQAGKIPKRFPKLYKNALKEIGFVPYSGSKHSHGDMFRHWANVCNDRYGKDTVTVFHNYHLALKRVVYCDMCHEVFGLERKYAEFEPGQNHHHDTRNIHVDAGRKPGKLRLLMPDFVGASSDGYTWDDVILATYAQLWTKTLKGDYAGEPVPKLRKGEPAKKINLEKPKNKILSANDIFRMVAAKKAAENAGKAYIGPSDNFGDGDSDDDDVMDIGARVKIIDLTNDDSDNVEEEDVMYI
jgi:hypothetical protein